MQAATMADAEYQWRGAGLAAFKRQPASGPDALAVLHRAINDTGHEHYSHDNQKD